MMLKKVFTILLVIAATFSYGNALKQNEIKEQMTKKIDSVLLVLE